MVLPPSSTPSLLSLNLWGIKSAVKPNWKTNGFVQWEASSINPHLMRRRKAEAETGEFAAVREGIHNLWVDGEDRRRERQVDGQTDGRVDREMKRVEELELYQQHCCIQVSSATYCQNLDFKVRGCSSVRVWFDRTATLSAFKTLNNEPWQKHLVFMITVV